MPAPTAETLAEALQPLTAAPHRAAIFCDVDGTIAPIVQRAEEARVPERTARLLGALGRRYACVACISGRSAAEARRLVGVGSITYAGAHGSETLAGGAGDTAVAPALAGWEKRIRRFAAERDERELRLARIRVEDKGPIQAFHWRGAPDEDRARAHVEEIAQLARASGLGTHWGRKVLEVRPPVEFGKGDAVRAMVTRSGARAALFGGDDRTDLEAFDALDALADDGTLETAVRVGVRSDEGPAEITERADLTVEGPSGFVTVLEALVAE